MPALALPAMAKKATRPTIKERIVILLKNVTPSLLVSKSLVGASDLSRVTSDRTEVTVAGVVKVVVAFLLVIHAAFNVVAGSFLGAVFGLRCTSSIGFQLRVEPDQRFGLALRAAA